LPEAENMKKLRMNRNGFTLVEMVLVIAIIAVLAAVSVFAVASYLQRASDAEANVSAQLESFDSAQDDINQNFVDFGY
jgi:prepilin-type N-terminal cleavage/methylation domain-containing protein